MTHPLHEFTHLDAIGVMAEAHNKLRSDPHSTLRELADAKRTLLKAEEFQFSLTQSGKNFYFHWFDDC